MHIDGELFKFVHLRHHGDSQNAPIHLYVRIASDMVQMVFYLYGARTVLGQ